MRLFLIPQHQSAWMSERGRGGGAKKTEDFCPPEQTDHMRTKKHRNCHFANSLNFPNEYQDIAVFGAACFSSFLSPLTCAPPLLSAPFCLKPSIKLSVQRNVNGRKAEHFFLRGWGACWVGLDTLTTCCYISVNQFTPISHLCCRGNGGKKAHLFVHPLIPWTGLVVLLRTVTKESSVIGSELSFGSRSSNKVQILKGSLRYQPYLSFQPFNV